MLFTGQLLEEELNQYYKKSNIYIQASGYEGLPHTLLEAISHNLSIVSTPIGGTNEILENNTNGWTVDLIEGKYPSEQQIAIKVLNILNNKREDEPKTNNASWKKKLNDGLAGDEKKAALTGKEFFDRKAGRSIKYPENTYFKEIDKAFREVFKEPANFREFLDIVFRINTFIWYK